MVMRCGEMLREASRVRTKFRAAQRALRKAYAPVARLITPLAPRHFELSGELRVYALGPDCLDLRPVLASGVAALDSALEAYGVRRWGDEQREWMYVDHWSDLDAAVARAQLAGSATPGPGGPLLHACLPASPVEAVTVPGGRRVVTARRLIEDLLGRHGPRYDLFARLVPPGLLEAGGWPQAAGSS